jgi:hypothetical protein
MILTKVSKLALRTHFKNLPLLTVKFRSMSNEAYLTAAANEKIEIVDSENNVLTPTTRAEMRTQKLIHRATYAFIRTPGNYFYVQKV